MVVGFIREISKQEVSCKIARMILKFADTNNVPGEKLLRGTGANLPYLFDPTNWTGENLIVRMLENLGSLMNSSDAAFLAGKNPDILAEDELFDLIFTIASSPALFYRHVPKWFGLHFKLADLQIIKEDDCMMTFHLQSRHARTLSNPLLHWFAGALAGASRAFGLPEAGVIFKPPISEQMRLYSILVTWKEKPGGSGTAKKICDEKKAEFLIRKIIRRLEKAESKKIDLDRLSFLLKESEGRFRAFFDNVMESVLIIDEGGFIFEANRKALDMLGRKREDLIGLPAAKLVDIGEEQMIVGLLNLARQGRPIPVIDLEFRRLDGRCIPVKASASSVIWPESSAPFKVIMNVKDMSSLHRSEEEARRMRDLNETIVSGMLEGVFVEDSSGTCQFANPRMEEMLGYGPGELKGIHWSKIVPEELIEPIEHELEKRRMGIKGSYEAMLKRKDGARLPVKISALPLFEQGSFAGCLSVLIDLSDFQKIAPYEKE
jgi:PAS domain S-box-containing protein